MLQNRTLSQNSEKPVSLPRVVAPWCQICTTLNPAPVCKSFVLFLDILLPRCYFPSTIFCPFFSMASLLGQFLLFLNTSHKLHLSHISVACGPALWLSCMVNLVPSKHPLSHLTVIFQMHRFVSLFLASHPPARPATVAPSFLLSPQVKVNCHPHPTPSDACPHKSPHAPPMYGIPSPGLPSSFSSTPMRLQAPPAPHFTRSFTGYSCLLPCNSWLDSRQATDTGL